MGKKSQISLFIIIGIILILIIGIFIWLHQALREAKIEEEKLKALEQIEVGNIRSYVQDCFQKTSDDALIIFGLKGGYIYDEDLEKGLVNEIDVPYYYNRGMDYSIDNGMGEYQLSKYISENIDFCIKNFKDFKEQDIKNEFNNVETRIQNKKITFKLLYPFEVQKQDKIVKNDDEYVHQKDLRIGEMIEISKEITSNFIENFDIDLSYLLELNEKDYDVVFMPIDENSNYYLIIDRKYDLNGLDYMFVFANKFA